jgi:Ca2+-binding EF-hand superfamily protein
MIKLLAASFAFSATLVAADPPKGEGRFDKMKLFEMMDTDKDNKVTKEEYKTFIEKIAEKAKEKGKGEKLAGGLGEKLFEKIDTDGDGTITKAEMEKFEMPKGEALKGKLKK